MYCIEESNCDIVGIFRRPPQPFEVLCNDFVPFSDSAPGDCAPLFPPRYAPGCSHINVGPALALV